MQHYNSSRPRSAGSYHSSANVHSAQSPAPAKGPKRGESICISEEVKMAINLAVERFRLNEDLTEYEFPSSLTATERAYIHDYAPKVGLTSKSRGKLNNRCLSIFKKKESSHLNTTATFDLVRNSRNQIHNLIQKYPLTNKERQDVTPHTERNLPGEVSKELNRTATGRLNNGVSQVPPKRRDSELNNFRQSLPIFKWRGDIVEAIFNNRVVLVSGETGSGKTTQVPQMILDQCHLNNAPCRIFCTQPRRIAALSIAERVAAERGEKVGQTVGYQIRLESRVSPKTLLTFCTNGVLLRTLMGGSNSLSTVTHVIIDEIHERDRFSDFLAICMRDLLNKHRNLKLILMSAALNIELFTKYFNNCPVVKVPGTLFEVKEYFLEDVLKMTDYTNKKMMKFKREQEKKSVQEEKLVEWCSKQLVLEETNEPETEDSDVGSSITDAAASEHELGEEKEELEDCLVHELDQLLSDAWLKGNEAAFSQIFHLIMSENVSVDYLHSETSVTPLMVAAGRGFQDVVEQLLNLGANVGLVSSNNWTALDWAKRFERSDIIEMLEAHLASSEVANVDEQLFIRSSSHVSEEDRLLLDCYHHSFDDEKVDTDLVLALLQKIVASQQEGAILVFLPGYDDIVSVRAGITEYKKFENTRYILYVLHSDVQSSDQKRVFKNPPHGVRKIVLATNIAETSITINDVVFVIDCGKVKEKSFDALTSVSMLKMDWISKASALQRKGRAGRCKPGICYHLFSKVRYDNFMQQYPQPEILRYPLQEICLHTKLLAPSNLPIADFLSKAPDPPAYLVTRNAVQILKQIDALDNWEDLTELGHHLTDLPVEPRLGKMVLYSIVLKCLDPVLTVVCTLAYKEPFMLPAQPYLKRACGMAKRKFAADSLSDHMALLRAFQAWQKARTDGWERNFCADNFLNSACMEMIVGMRTQLLGQLRASGFVRARGVGDIRDLNSNSENWAVIKAALCAGAYPCILKVNRKKKFLEAQKETKVRFHNSSVLSPPPNEACARGAANQKKMIRSLPSDWLFYDELTRVNSSASVRCCTVVSAITVAVFSGPAKLPGDALKNGDAVEQGNFIGETSDSESEDKDESFKSTVRFDEWLSFKSDAETAHLVLQLRQKWHSLFIRRMRSPSRAWSYTDEAVVKTLINVLTNEEQTIGLQQPAGIGQRPKPMASDTILSGSGGRGVDSDDWRSTRKSMTPTPPKREMFHASDTILSGSGGRGPESDDWRANRKNKTPTPPKREMFHEKGSWDGRPSSSPANNSPTNNNVPRNFKSNSNSPCISPLMQASPFKVLDKEQRGTEETKGKKSCYFFIKCPSQRHLDVALNDEIWTASAHTEKKLNAAFQADKNIYLIFSIQESGNFQGYAKLTSSSSKCESGKSGGSFNIDWIKRGNVPFQNVQLKNPWNNNKKIQQNRDGQEIEPSVGRSFLKLWDKFDLYRKDFKNPVTTAAESSSHPGAYSSRSPESNTSEDLTKLSDDSSSGRSTPNSPSTSYSSNNQPGSYNSYNNYSQENYHSAQGGYGHFGGYYGGNNASQTFGANNMGYFPRQNMGFSPGFSPQPMFMHSMSNPSSQGMMMQSPPQHGVSPVMILQRGNHSSHRHGYGRRQNRR